MLIYVPTLIESVEQAEKLPEGTLAVFIDGTNVRSCARLSADPVGPWKSDMHGYRHGTVIGYLALVPVAAEEYHSEPMGTRHHLDPVTGPKPMTAWVTET